MKLCTYVALAIGTGAHVCFSIFVLLSLSEKSTRAESANVKVQFAFNVSLILIS